MVISSDMIAPCGMNCGICISHLREKKRCEGCRNMDLNKPEGCRKCLIRWCKVLSEKKMRFCSDKCEKFPCLRLRNLDKRYRAKYGMSMLENLDYIERLGIRRFVSLEKEKWKCKSCGAVLSCHRDRCLVCGFLSR